MRLDEAGIDHLVLEAVVDLVRVFVEPGLEIVEGDADRKDLAVGNGDGGCLRPAGVHGDELLGGEHGDLAGWRRRLFEGVGAGRAADRGLARHAEIGAGSGDAGRHGDARPFALTARVGRGDPFRLGGNAGFDIERHRFAEHAGKLGDAIGAPVLGRLQHVVVFDADARAVRTVRRDGRRGGQGEERRHRQTKEFHRGLRMQGEANQIDAKQLPPT